MMNKFGVSEMAIQEIVDKYQIEYQIVFKGGEVRKDYFVTGCPALFLIDTETKKVIYNQTGYSTQNQEELEKVIQRELKNRK